MKFLLSRSSFFASLLLALFSTTAFAEDAPAQGGAGMLFNILFFGGFLLIFYFLMWRPQAKQAKAHRELMASLAKGDEVMTTGGVAGKIVRVTDSYAVVEVAPNVEMKIQRASVASALPKGTLKDI